MTNTSDRLQRISVNALDNIVGQQFSVLDDGFIRLIDYMGDDSAIVQAARVSYGAGTKLVQEDRNLIRYLMRHKHTTPFEMCEIKLHIRAPMDVWRQWIRHRTASVNEYSTRYSVAIDAAQKTDATAWRLQSSQNRQGSLGFLPQEEGNVLSAAEAQIQTEARSVYEARLAKGVAREQARKDLPLSTYTEAYWKIDLHNLLHFLQLRMERAAQFEIRSYADVIGEMIVARWVPLTWEAFLDYRRNAIEFSRTEFDIIVSIMNNAPDRAYELANAAGLLRTKESGILKGNRERTELEEKLRTLGLTIPWSEKMASNINLQAD